MNFTGTYLKSNSNQWVYIFGLVNNTVEPNFNVEKISRMLGTDYSVIYPILKGAGAQFFGDGDDEPIVAFALDEMTMRNMIEEMEAFLIPFRLQQAETSRHV